MGANHMLLAAGGLSRAFKSETGCILFELHYFDPV